MTSSALPPPSAEAVEAARTVTMEVLSAQREPMRAGFVMPLTIEGQIARALDAFAASAASRKAEAARVEAVVRKVWDAARSTDSALWPRYGSWSEATGLAQEQARCVARWHIAIVDGLAARPTPRPGTWRKAKRSTR